MCALPVTCRVGNWDVLRWMSVIIIDCVPLFVGCMYRTFACVAVSHSCTPMSIPETVYYHAVKTGSKNIKYCTVGNLIVFVIKTYRYIYYMNMK